MGTAAGTKVFISHGWRAAACLSMGWYAWIVVILLLRGPHCERFTWVGYEGGLEARKSVVDARTRDKERNEGGQGGRESAGTDSEKATVRDLEGGVVDEKARESDGPVDEEKREDLEVEDLTSEA